MAGIAGIVNGRDKKDADILILKDVRQMLKCISHRKDGISSFGVFLNIAVGFRELSLAVNKKTSGIAELNSKNLMFPRKLISAIVGIKIPTAKKPVDQKQVFFISFLVLARLTSIIAVTNRLIVNNFLKFL